MDAQMSGADNPAGMMMLVPPGDSLGVVLKEWKRMKVK